jgi:hypothetical protein
MLEKKDNDEMFERIKGIKDRDQNDLIDALDFKYAMQNIEFRHLKSIYRNSSKGIINLDPKIQSKWLTIDLMQTMKGVDQGLKKVNRQIEKHQRLLKSLLEQKEYLEKIIPKKYQKIYFEAKKK